MRPRFRSEPGPRSTREGRPLELVRVRGTQRDPGHDARELKQRRRRRGGRRRTGGPKPPSPPAPKFSLPRWLASIFTRRPAAPIPVSVSEQEAVVLRDFSRHYGLNFKDAALLKQALTHRSYLSVTGGDAYESNERLEFLGDSVLGLVTSEHMFRTKPGEHEGQLTKTKSLLVSKAILSRRALAMGLGRFVLMSHSEIESGGRQRLSILADAFESVIGAVYLDLGFEAARGFIERWLLKDAPDIVADKRHMNYKSHLQEYVQSTFRTHPVYRIRSEMGPDHSKHFMVEVSAGRRVLGEGRGKNKKDAEQAAARHALDRVTGTRGRETPAREGRERETPVREGRERETPVREGRERERQEPRDRERREPRDRERPETRDREEPRDREPARRGGGSAPTATAIEGHGAETESDELRRGRRRGRRGGRGRRRPEGGSPARPDDRPLVAGGDDEEAVTPRAAEAAPAPETRRPFAARGPARGSAREPVREQRFERPREIEPLPPAMAEDEIEEIGRPEGPPGERFLDPFASGAPAWESAEAEPSGPFDSGGAREHEVEEEEAVSEAPPVIERSTRREPREPETGNAAGESEAKGKEPGAPVRDDASGYGRRRGRRGPSDR